ncbi:MAG: nickel pincer cofactor biosynthesis protein LarC [Candidatus Firestonebacteria bacterium]|nr:nickel pincer cofactor biosynthesis protein LarC [Candidatus Firestonebacteria bacterium]
MKILYFDIIAGASGNMILGAFLDAGLNLDYLKEELSKLNLSYYNIEIKKEQKNHIFGTLLNVNVDYSRQPLRTYHEIEEIIKKSSLSEKIKNKSLSIFKRLAQVEAGIHNTQVSQIHFHEVGAVDSIIDIVGSVIGFEYFKSDKIYSSPLINGSSGYINSSHGKLPNPAPATLELLKNIPCKTIDIQDELTTPTGAAILCDIVDEFGVMPEMHIKHIGYGAGNKNFNDIPNLLRIVIGDTQYINMEIDFVSVIETNIDNMNPEHYDWLIEEAISKGALDVFLTPIIMKKSRSAVSLTIITPLNLEKKIAEFVLKNTTTFGVRISNLRRKKLFRKMDSIDTRYGKIRIKIGYMNNEIVKVSPEYEDVKKLASSNNVSPQEITNEVIKIVETYK